MSLQVKMLDFVLKMLDFDGKNDEFHSQNDEFSLPRTSTNISSDGRRCDLLSIFYRRYLNQIFEPNLQIESSHFILTAFSADVGLCLSHRAILRRYRSCTTGSTSR